MLVRQHQYILQNKYLQELCKIKSYHTLMCNSLTLRSLGTPDPDQIIQMVIPVAGCGL